MTNDRCVFSLGILAEAICQLGGCEQERLRCLSLVGPPLVFSLIETIQSNNEGQMQKKLVELADHISEKEQLCCLV